VATEARINITAKDRTKGALGSVKQGLGGLKSTVFGVQGAIAALAGAGGFGVLIKRSLATGDALGKTADKLGTTTEALAGMRLAAERTAGVSGKVLDTALQRLVRRTSEAAQGAGAAKDVIKELGLEAQTLSQMTADEQMSAIADAMEAVTNQGDRVRISMKLFDTEGAALEKTLKGGSAALEEYQKQADEFGLAISRVDAAKFEAANDAMENVGASIEGIATGITIGLAPALTMAAESMLTLTTDTNNWAKSTDNAVRFALNAFDMVKESVNVLVGAFNLFGTAVNAAWAKVAEGIAWVFGKLAALAEWIPGEFGEKMIAGFTAVQESALIFSEITGDAADQFSAKTIENTELMGTFAETSVKRYEAVQVAAQKSAKGQVVAFKTVSKEMKKTLEENGKWLAMEAAAKAQADQKKAWSQDQYVGAAVSAGNALFENNKGVKAGLVIVDTASSIMNAMSSLPWPANLAAAASAAAMGAAQLAAVRSASKGGGGAPSAAAGGGASFAGGGGGFDSGGAASSPAENPTLADAPAAASTTTANISLQGGLYSKDDIRQLIESINEELGDGATLEVAA
jgi:hypothetical protein